MCPYKRCHLVIFDSSSDDQLNIDESNDVLHVEFRSALLFSMSDVLSQDRNEIASPLLQP
jgi:hypothetical protein